MRGQGEEKAMSSRAASEPDELTEADVLAEAQIGSQNKS